MSSTIPFDAYKGAEPFIFVSYAHKDRDSVFPLILALHQQGYRIWYDEGIDPGNEWPDEIAHALERASQFIVFISPHAVASRNVRNEINLALDCDRKFIAIHLVETQLPSGLKLSMGSIQAIFMWKMSEEHFSRKLAGSLAPTLKQSTASVPAMRLDEADEKRLAEEKRQRGYMAAVGAAEAAFKKQDFAAAELETQTALGLRRDGAEALALAERLLPTLEVRSVVDGKDTSGAVIAFSGKATAHKTPVTFKFESGKTYEVSVSLPAADGRSYSPAEKTFVVDWFGPQVWTAKLDASKPRFADIQRERFKMVTPTLRVPAGCRVAEGTVAEPYSKSRWAQEVVHAATGMAFRFIPPGTFTMGSPEGEEGRRDNEVQHRVTLTQGFYLGKYQVTQAQWEKTMGANPSNFKGPDLPVETVSWDDCQAFLKKFGTGARLPTEAEWEYACRAGTTTALNNGKKLTSTEGQCPNLDEVAWYDKNSGGKTHPVGQKQPNAWGLYDMHGNVWEWCADWYGAYPTGAATDPQGSQTGSFRVLRGGSWYYFAYNCRVAYRYFNRPALRNLHYGFRAVLPPGQQ
jgi:formylglycine-generating enzyme required for sulfatase activity